MFQESMVRESSRSFIILSYRENRFRFDKSSVERACLKIGQTLVRKHLICQNRVKERLIKHVSFNSKREIAHKLCLRFSSWQLKRIAIGLSQHLILPVNYVCRYCIAYLTPPHFSVCPQPRSGIRTPHDIVCFVFSELRGEVIVPFV